MVRPAAGIASLDEARVWRVLAEVGDPELPFLSVVDLGIVRSVSLADGVVRESGSHEQLMQSNGLYYDMWQAQAQQDVVDAESKAVAAMASDDRL